MKDIKISYWIDKKTKRVVDIAHYYSEDDVEILCPYCLWRLGFKKGRAINKNWEIRQSHFFHIDECATSKVGSSWESEKHKLGKEYFTSLFQSTFWNAWVVETEHYFSQIDRVADLYFHFLYQNKEVQSVIEIQYSNISEEDLFKRHRDYQSLLINDIRVVGLSYDSDGNIENKTLSLIDKILSFQKSVFLIDGMALYTLNKKKGIRIVDEIKLNTDRENFIFQIFSDEIGLKKSFDILVPIQKANTIKNIRDLKKLEIYDLWMNFFVENEANIFDFQTKKINEIKKNQEKLFSFIESLEICKVEEKFYEYLLILISVFDEVVQEIREMFKSRLKNTYPKLNEILYGKKNNIKKIGFFGYLLDVIRGMSWFSKKTNCLSPSSFSIFLKKMENVLSILSNFYQNFDLWKLKEDSFLDFCLKKESKYFDMTHKYWILFWMNRIGYYEKKEQLAFIFKYFCSNKGQEYIARFLHELHNKYPKFIGNWSYY